MKLAEALILRADTQKKIQQLSERLNRSAKVQEGDNPPENPADLLAELDQLVEQLTLLIRQINRTNSQTAFADGRTLTDALAERDTAVLKRSILAKLIESAAVTQSRYSRSEVKFYSTIEVANLQKQVDTLSKQHRELDTRIQELNWQTELIEI